MTDKEPADLLKATVRIGSAYISRNPVPIAEIASVLSGIHQSLAGLREQKSETEPLTPAVPIRRSVKDEAVTCLECGKPMSMLKRHLRVEHGLTPEEYRAKWSLPRDYPVVAPAYARQRSEAAKRIGLGKKTVRRRGRSRKKAAG